jgi:hypothetical protein
VVDEIAIVIAALSSGEPNVAGALAATLPDLDPGQETELTPTQTRDSAAAVNLAGSWNIGVTVVNTGGLIKGETREALLASPWSLQICDVTDDATKSQWNQ